MLRDMRRVLADESLVLLNKQAFYYLLTSLIIEHRGFYGYYHPEILILKGSAIRAVLVLQLLFQQEYFSGVHLRDAVVALIKRGSDRCMTHRRLPS
ncbi:hypothetical protein AVEN_196853-1 [Araneus ventricosus]|uniref:Uncharacterized protein n=1 Tax=Araneus ventricosus TaxID=182803 RepID=A0A4Y2QTK3_ARAVE|nr:hypothetical protein AVEN_196853-1 [Araneus ventricosus]